MSDSKRRDVVLAALVDGYVLDTAGAGELAGLPAATVQKYRTRGDWPEPDAMIGRTPVWLRPTVEQWLREREARWSSAKPGRGARRDRLRTQG